MPVTLKIDIKPKTWLATDDFARRYRRRMVLAMNIANSVVHGQVRTYLSGPSHTRFPGNGNPFPGTLTGRMKNSVHSRVKSDQDGVVGITGPNVKYARRQDNLRPFLKPALEAQLLTVERIFQAATDDLAAGA